jgi:hypothetical protein
MKVLHFMSSINLYIGSKLISNQEKNFSTQLSSKNRHKEKYVIHPTELKMQPTIHLQSKPGYFPRFASQMYCGLYRRLKEASILHLTIHFNSIFKK